MARTKSTQNFDASRPIRVREVELSPADSPQQHREKLARIVLDHMYQFVALLDAGGTLLDVNRAALEGAGILLENTLGKPFWEARWWQVSQETRAQIQEAVHRCARGEFVRYDVEIYGEASGDRTIIIDFSLIPVHDADGKVVFLLPEGRNITEKKRAEAEIARKNEELEKLLAKVRELDEIKSEFFANVSHELRTPLALISGPADRILNEAQGLPAEQQRDLRSIRRNASLLLKHVNDLLDIAKLDAGQMVLAYRQADLASLTRALSGHFEALAAERSITFTLRGPTRLPAEVDPEKIERVLLNLLSNAFKFTPSGGRITVSLDMLNDARALITVQDSGPGVRADQRAVIFERFRQADGGSTREFGGTGLGLAIVRDFVDLHGGVVSVTDAPGGGALFQIELPVAAPAGMEVRPALPQGVAGGPDGTIDGALVELQPVSQPGPTGPVARPDAAAHGAGAGRVLVVEDNPELARFIMEVLSPDLRVEHAADGEAALMAASASPPDVIVTDLMMPRMSGDQLLARLREDPQLDTVPVLVLTAKADDALRARLLRDGAQDYVVKPFSAEELSARVRNLLSAKRARDVLQAELASREHDLEKLARQTAARKRELQKAMDALEITRDAALAASRTKSRFLNLISHELRSPLMSLDLQAQLLKQVGIAETSPHASKAVEALERGTRRLNDLFSSLMQHAKLQGATSLSPIRPFDLGELVKEVAEEMRPHAEAKGLGLSVTESVELPALRSDQRAVNLIVTNLVDNALKYTESGDVTLEPALEGDDHVVHVRDTGPGIDPTDMKRIFEPFVQGEDLDRKHTPGVGLGLAIVKDLVTALGGRLEVTSDGDRGTTFSVRLPSRKSVLPADG